MGADSPDNISADRRGHVRSGVTADRADRADPTDMAAPPTFTTTEAAVRLGVSERTVRRYVERGKLEARLVMTHRGEEWHIAAADVETFRQQRDAIRSRPIVMDDSESPATTDMAADAHGQPVRTLTPAVVQALVAPLVAEIERLATEKGQAEGERDILRQQLTERENQAHDLVGELRRRAEVAEQEAAELRRARRQMPWWLRLLGGGR
jgi:excisionase family DNA binding protein